MASNPPFNMEDQTDEDFFDKLVEDDFEPTMPSSPSTGAAKPVDGTNFDNTSSFANLSIADDSGDEEQSHREKEVSDPSAGEEANLSASKADDNREPLMVESNSLSPSNELAVEGNGVMELQNEGSGLEAEALPRSDSIEASSVNGSGGSRVKEVGWNAFYADSMDNSGHDGLDFFGDLGNNAAGFPGNTEDGANCGDYTAMGITQPKDIGSDKSVNDCNPVDQIANGQDSSDNQYWENMYPGWKYDPATGQWYQVDNHEQSMNSLQNDGDLTTAWGKASDRNTEVAYLRQSNPSVVSKIAETSTTESISNWNQDSQANGGYPDHMVFDPQYPGWYYDTIAQEWRALDSYNALSQSADQVHDLKNQNGYSSVDGYSNDIAGTMLSENGQADKISSEDLGSQGQHVSWTNYNGTHSNEITNSWQPEIPARTGTVAFSATASGFNGNQQVDNFYGSNGFVDNLSSGYHSYDKASQGQFETNGLDGAHTFVPDMNLDQQFSVTNMKQSGQMGFSTDFYGSQQSLNVPQQSFQPIQQFPYGPSSGLSPDGRPPHAIVTFGFGGKLILMKDNSLSSGSQTSGRNSISILNVMEAVAGSDNLPGLGAGTSNYFSTLCHQSFPGPLAGGSVGSKDLHKWIDERMPNCESLGPDHRKGELLKLLLSLLKIACQHYGKLRSPFGTNTTVRESDSPESAVAKLFTSTKKKGMGHSMYGALSHCLQHIPPEQQLQTAASEVQNLLVSGRKMEALQCAQEGQLWGPALIIAAQLGEQFYVDTVKQMALRQLTAGSPLRTLCLLIAGQPAEVFSSNNVSDGGLDGSTIMSHQNQNGYNSMLDDWEENLAVITANRTKDDELVITHLGDCLWKDRSEITAAHICYIIAEMNFEPYSDTARLCLIGSDHWKFPRTYASPEAIQRTELYEYSKVLGNSQYMLLLFQPYKIIYAHMLAEVGKLSDAMKYCQVVQKSLKTGRSPEVDMWKQLVSSLEERIRVYQQGGFTNLAPAKLVGKLLNFFDSTAHRVVGGLPPPAPTSQGNTLVNGQNHRQGTGRVSASQSTMAMSSLMPSDSMEPISAWAGDGSKMKMHNRSVSEPDFSRTPQVDSSTKELSGDAQGKNSGTAGVSRFSRFGLLQKTVDLVRWSRGRQAKLGEENKFYYDEKLKRWVEKGAEISADEPALAPPPTTAAFQNGNADFGGTRPATSEMSPTSTNPGFSPPNPDSSSGMQLKLEKLWLRRTWVFSLNRYVDTFNKGRPNAAASTFRSPAAPSVKPPPTANTNFFIPTTPIDTEEHNAPSTADPTQVETLVRPEDNYSNTSVAGLAQTFQTPPAASSAMTIQRFPSMDHIRGSAAAAPNHLNGNFSGHSRRTASWGGSFDVMAGGRPINESGPRPLGEVLGLPHSAYMSGPLPANALGDELQEVEL
ncbi:PREDICTED: protein transport protein SEC16B homolog [Tarenaya hassleriana]|uniref:protein transport protein SEC16B homolog n=1 Tax=Tarenaya hassleriana TaxID=28532 RepID=UPI00053C0E38|nr:PREDICTED: protein transport protein SEC16B homolog [Tarenaya hassleriana]